MHSIIAGRRLELHNGDITAQAVDAIVNAANQSLAGGGGVDGAIHRRGGPAIMAETSQRYPDGCPTGSAVISGAGNLAAKFVIHAVAPRWAGGNRGEPELLRSAYLTAFNVANQQQCRSIALPSLGTGAYGYPLSAASQIAISTAIASLQQQSCKLEMVRFVLFGDEAFRVFADTLTGLTSM